MNEKIIHYCWFGNGPKPSIIKKCLKSWTKFCPDYKIIEWNENNFNIECCDYVKEAYKAKKWAFVSDYCRFHVLFNHGGTYLDTDVELIKDLERISDTCVGFENQNKVNSGLVRRAKKGDKICKKMLESYHNDHFINNDGSYNLRTVCDRETELLTSMGLKANNTFQIINNTTIYPKDYFNPVDMNTGKFYITNNTISIHHYAASWFNRKNKIKKHVYRFLCRIIGEKNLKKLKFF